jgi:type I restriction-modification system DNA methylase subunit
MASSAQDILQQILKKGGFVQEGKRSSGLIDAETAKVNATTDLRYRHLFNTSRENGPVIDLVYEVPNQASGVPGTPSIYFKVLEELEPSAETIKNLRSLVWNQGHAPTLWIVTPASVLIYNSYARPQKDDDEKSHLLEELKQIGGQIKLLDEFYKKNFDTGDFWQSKYGKKIDKQQRVDMAMLADLTATEDVLIRELYLSRPELPLSVCVSIAHALLGRVIFVSYLVDRGLLDSHFFRREYDCNSFHDLLDDQEATYTFFGWLRKTFNGDLFPFEKEEQKLVEKPHLQIVKEFLSGSDMNSYSKSNFAYQKRFWPYKFDFIPIELISSIYEKFAHSRNSSAAEASSIHYTRLPLVELVLSLAMKDIPHTAKVLDPACGSGIFLVEAFRRLVWKKEKEYGQPVRRNELHEMLRSQIFGIDIDRDAIHVTAFSLYLTLLELDPDPQPLEALKFPPLLSSDPLSNQPPNVYIQDFCNTEHIFNHFKPFVSKQFDLIVGNPPWTALKKADAPRDPDNPVSGRQWSLEYCREKNIPDSKPDQAFIIRARDFAHPGTRVALVVCSRIFYQQQDPHWLDTFLCNVTIDTVVNLSDLVGEDVLFGGNSSSSTRLPASVVVFRVVAPAANNKVMYLTPKWQLSADKQNEIIISAEDIHYLSQKLLRGQPFLWKSAFRGTARDYRLLNRLQSLSSLNIVLSKIGVKELSHVGITYGRGAQKPTPPDLIGKPYLASKSDARYSIDVTPLPPFDRETIAKKSNTKYLHLPALVLWRSLKEERPCVALAEGSHVRHNLVINKAYYGIPLLGISPPTLIYRLNAILNSELAFYMAFMFSSALGWDRHLIEPVDWLQVRLPDSILNHDTDLLWTKILQREQWLRENWQPNLSSKSLKRTIAHEQNLLEQDIFQLYDLSEQEILLVVDTIQFSIKPILSKDLRVANAHARASIDDLRSYARRMCSQLNGILHYSGQELTATIIQFNQPCPLRVCRFTQKNRGNSEMITVEHLQDIDGVINQMAKELQTEVTDHMYIQRSLRVYKDDGFWIIKGVQKHLWSETAALNDADAVVREYMEAVVD